MRGIDRADLDACGCCVGKAEEPGHENRPALSAVSYRLGIHPDFLARMKNGIHRWEILICDECGRSFLGPGRADEIRCHLSSNHGLTGAAAEEKIVASRPLAGLTTRTADDPAVALMDAWALAADVLTFYQERIANEGFLRTATERRSVLELARAIGYELDPGVAAETWLAFKVDDARGAPTEAVVSKGTQVQSIPAGEGELPQTFETGEELTAHVRWNAMRPLQACPQRLTGGVRQVYLSGTGLGLEKGGLVLLIVGAGRYPRRIGSVAEDNEARRTTIELVGEETEPLREMDPDPEPDAEPVADQAPLELTADHLYDHIYNKIWDETELQAFLSHNGWDADEVLAYIEDRRAKDLKGTEEQQLHALREKVAFFGHNAPYYLSLPKEVRREDTETDKAWPNNWDENEWDIWKDSITDEYYDDGFHAYLDRPVPELVADSWAVLEAPSEVFKTYKIAGVLEISRAGFGMSSKVTGITFGNLTEKNPSFTLRDTIAHVKSEQLELGTVPCSSKVAKKTTELWLGSMVLGLREGQRVALQGEDFDTEGYMRHEILTLAAVIHSRGLTKLRFDAPGLAYSYKRDTISINANLTLASHGETVAGEVLGSGDGSVTHQAFELKRPPLTYVATGTASGSRSTLTVRVDGVEWKETSSLYFLGPNSRSYVIRIADNAKARVIFGDGRKGARLPTGQENIGVDYRSGIGLEGEVGKNSLTLLKKRPFGIREVTNPLAAGGADNPEVFADARENAPLTVLTLDRIVSLQDYEDFARAFPGIGKAQAIAVWDGENEVVHVTVADSSGNEVVPPLDGYLRGAIEAARDPLRKVRLASFQRLSFFVSAKLKIDEEYLWEDLRAAVETALLEAFSFDKRALGQPATAAEVIQVMRGVEGVGAVDLDWLDKTAPPRAPSGASFDKVLDARVARFQKDHPDGPRILPAQLLLVHPLGIGLTEMTA